MKELQFLLVEDDLDLANAVIDYLELEGMQCDHAANGVSGFTLIQQNPYDAVILDLNLPKMNGLEVCANIRAQGIDVPILMLTAKDTLEDKLTGFAKGADDYLVKPFAMQELIARVQILSRRRSGEMTKLALAGIEMDFRAKKVMREGAELKLTPIGFKLLETLLRASPAIVSREKLIQSVWKNEQPDSNSLKVHLHNLRKAVDGQSEQKLIHTVVGKGFVLKGNS